MQPPRARSKPWSYIRNAAVDRGGSGAGDICPCAKAKRPLGSAAEAPGQRAGADQWPLFAALMHYTNPDLEAFSERNPVTVTADDSTCKLHVFVTAFTKFSNCDRAQDLVTKLGVSFKTESARSLGDKVNLKISSTSVEGFDAGNGMRHFSTRGIPTCSETRMVRLCRRPPIQPR